MCNLLPQQKRKIAPLTVLLCCIAIGVTLGCRTQEPSVGAPASQPPGAHVAQSNVNAGAAAPSSPQVTCTVADPTGTPLNVRQVPGGQILGTVANGSRVQVVEERADDKGRMWSNIVSSDQLTGWVFRDYIRCAEVPGTATAAAPHAKPLSLDDEALQEAEKHFDKLMTRCGEDTYAWRTGQGVYIYHQAEGRRIIVRSQPVRALTEADRRNGVPERQWKGQAEVWFATGRNFLPSSNRLSRWKDAYTYERTAILEKNGGKWTISDARTSVEAPIKCSDFPSS